MPRQAQPGFLVARHAGLGLAAVAFVAFRGLGAVPGPGPGIPVGAPDGFGHAELVRFDDELVDALLKAPVEGAVHVDGWPVMPGVREPVELVRHDVYAKDARLYRVDAGGAREIPRSRLHFLWGRIAGDRGRTIQVTVDPDARTVEAITTGTDGKYWLKPDPSRSGEGLLAAAASHLGALGVPLERSCGQESVPVDADAAPQPESSGGEPDAIQWLHTATVAVDTDNELLLLKFADNTTSATNYLAQLFAALNPDYERDLLVRLLQGTTYLRVSSVPDPYTGGTGGADLAKLVEFRDYWRANHAGVTRAVAMLLSGKQASNNSSSGIAYINVLCSGGSGGFGFSFTQVFKFAGSTGASDGLVVGHELGHNFGSRHTHCYLTPTPIDTCYASESGCYTGATSCPTPQTYQGVPNVRGTWMSYCHLLGGCSSAEVFHPRTIDIIDPLIQSRVGNCIFPSGAVQEASPNAELRASKGSGSSVAVTYLPACGAQGHTVYRGDLATLQSGGISWSARHCSFDNSGTLTFDPGASGSWYFVVAGRNGTQEGSYGQNSSGVERPAAGAGGACSYTQVLGGTCP